MNQNAPLLEITGLKKYFPIHGGLLMRRIGWVYAVDDVSLTLPPGRTLGLVGESGCGKTTVGHCILRIHRPTAGKIAFEGRDLGELGKKALRQTRRHIQAVFQDPYESLNPRHTVEYILEEPFRIHNLGDRRQRREKALRLLDRVGLSQKSANRFPHEFSGGQRQRLGIARAIALSPRLVICDEPVSALDVSIQSQILNLLLELQEEMGFAYLFIAHDLAVVRHIADTVAVMYLGKIVELTDADTIYQNPRHPYSRALISAIPVPDPAAVREKKVLAGDVPSPADPPPGCRFHTRCPHKTDICTTVEPPLQSFGYRGERHLVACHHAEKLD